MLELAGKYIETFITTIFFYVQSLLETQKI